MKPPNILTAARITAINPIIFEIPKRAGPTAIRAPTIMTLDIAFVTDIKGECKAGVTLHIT